MNTYHVNVANTFDADDPIEALEQMVAWLVDYASRAGYRVTNVDTDESVFLDAEDVLS